jgi:DNA-binding NtrC family response regulator
VALKVATNRLLLPGLLVMEWESGYELIVSEPFEGTETWAVDEEADTEVGILAVVAGPDDGQEHAFADGVVTVGSGPNAGIRVSDPSVSRLHVELLREGGRVRIRDLGSKNGTWLGGCQVLEAWLTPGTRVRLGSTVVEARVASRRVRRSVWQGDDRFGPLLGASPAMRDLFARLAKIAGTDSRVLVRGESGTGKELVAHALHQSSKRRRGPFVVVDGAALSTTLADDELFGHVRGAYTGAHADRAGAFERAHGGTLFLDEVGDIPLEVQKKLLRALESGSVQRVGGSDWRTVDVRVIAATHKPLERMVNEGTFREDLLYRLSVLDVRVPSLRDRPDDIGLIARAVLDEVSPGDVGAHESVERALAGRVGYAWPGNVRELRNYVQRVAVLGHVAAEPLPADGPQEVRVDLPYAQAKEEWVGHFERKYVARILDESGGNISEAARRSELSRVHLSNLVGRLGLRKR